MARSLSSDGWVGTTPPVLTSIRFQASNSRHSTWQFCDPALPLLRPLLFDLALLEEDFPPNDWVEFNELEFVRRFGHTLAGGVEKASPGRRVELDGHRLILAPGHRQHLRGTHGEE